MGKYIALCSFRVYSKLEIDSKVGDTDAGAGLLFKNPLHQVPLCPSSLRWTWRVVLPSLLLSIP